MAIRKQASKQTDIHMYARVLLCSPASVGLLRLAPIICFVFQ